MTQNNIMHRVLTNARSILVIAEKPKVAKAIKMALEHLFSVSSSIVKGKTKFNPIYEMSKGSVKISITSVSGFLYSYDFPSPYAKKDPWKNVDPISLVTVTPVRVVSGTGKFASNTKLLIEQLRDLAKTHDVAVIATDNDYAGERIGYQIWDTLRTVNKNIPAIRMIFTSTSSKSIEQAWLHPRSLRIEYNNAEIARALSDLLMGAIFTRQFTLMAQQVTRSPLLSYGMCQSLVLKHVVDKWRAHHAFVPKPYWYAMATIKMGSARFSVKWDLGNEFDQVKARSCFDLIKNETRGTVTNTSKTSKTKEPPTPLRTAMLQSSGSSLFKASPKDVMDVAEDLYLSGFTSYPRTESDTFSSTFDAMPILGQFLQHPDYGNYTMNLLKMMARPSPRKGTHRTEEHEPIHPVKMGTNATVFASVKPKHKKLAYSIYDYVSRRFIASCSHPATLDETKVTITIGNITFTLIGDVITNKGYLGIYPFDKVNETIIPPITIGDVVSVEKIEIIKDKTMPPPLVTYAQIIKDLDSLRIGTDATLHAHVQTVLDRGYVRKDKNHLIPTELGLSLIEALEDISPQLIDIRMRAKLEKKMDAIADGKQTMTSVLGDFKQIAMASYRELRNKEPHFVKKVTDVIVKMALPSQPLAMHLGSCPTCGKDLCLGVKKWKTTESRYAQCAVCDRKLPLPKKGFFEVLHETCPQCKKGRIVRVNKKYHICPICFTTATSGTLPCFKCTFIACARSMKSKRS